MSGSPNARQRTSSKTSNKRDTSPKTRDGRRNHYEVHAELPLRHPKHRHRTVGELIRFLQPEAGDRREVIDAPDARGRVVTVIAYRV